MLKHTQPIRTIARKEMTDARRDGFIIIVSLFLLGAALISLFTGSLALSTDVSTYNAARDTLLALGKSAADLASPEFYPLKLMRGAVEQLEIIGAVIGILVGFRAAASERGRLTLALIMTRPLAQWQFLAGKLVGGIGLLSLGLGVVVLASALLLNFSAGITLTFDDYLRMSLLWASSLLYTSTFFILSFLVAIWMKKLPTALLLSFIMWLLLVLVAPQIGDTLDPDNQVAGGVFKQLHIAKPDQMKIMQTFSGFESVRTGIEAISVTKHFERFNFAVLGIKDTYTGVPLSTVLAEKANDLLWLLGSFLVLGALLFLRRFNFNQLLKE